MLILIFYCIFNATKENSGGWKVMQRSAFISFLISDPCVFKERAKLQLGHSPDPRGNGLQQLCLCRADVLVGKAVNHLTHNKSSIPVNSQFSVTVGRMQENNVFHFGIFELVSHISTAPCALLCVKGRSTRGGQSNSRNRLSQLVFVRETAGVEPKSLTCLTQY